MREVVGADVLESKGGQDFSFVIGYREAGVMARVLVDWRPSVVIRPPSNGCAQDVVPRLLSLHETEAPQRRQAAVGVEPCHGPFGDRLLIQPVEGFTYGDQLDRAR